MSQRNAPPAPPGSSDDSLDLAVTDEGPDSNPDLLTMPGVPLMPPPGPPGYTPPSGGTFSGVGPGRGGRQFGKIPTPTTPFVPPHMAQNLNPAQIVRPAAGRPAYETAQHRHPAPPPPQAPLRPPSLNLGTPLPPGMFHPTAPPASGVGPVQNYPSSSPQQAAAGVPPASIRGDVAPPGVRPNAAHVIRSRAYSFVLDARGMPIEIGSGRSAKAYLGEERWIESKTDCRRDVIIKILQKGITEEDLMRFQMEKELLERVQGHPNIVHLFASGEGEDPEFIPAAIRDKVDCEFVILERLEMSLEERLKGSRQKGKRDDLLACDMRERIFRVLDYMIPVAAAVEYAHLVRNVCHRDIKPANVLIGLPNRNLRGSTLEVRLADFNVAKLHDAEINFQMTRTSMKSVPGTLFFQSPEQETNLIELLVNVTQGSAEVEFFEDFYIQIEKNDTFALFNRGDTYPIMYADRTKKKIVLARPYRDVTESNVRAKVQKSVGRPADIYSLGAMLYYLISGAYANPKTLYDNFHKFIEYERADETNTIQGYLEHEYSVINSLRAPKGEQGVEVAPADRFFSYKHYLDGNGDLIDPHVMMIVAKCMIRNKPDSYCQAHDIETRGVSDVVQDMIDLYTVFGVHPSARPANIGRLGQSAAGRSLTLRVGSRVRWLWVSFLNIFRGRK